MKTKLYLLLVILLSLPLSGCQWITSFDSTGSIVAPDNDLLPLEGLWDIDDFKPISEEAGSQSTACIGQKAAFSKNEAFVAGEISDNVTYRIRSVKTTDYFLFNYDIEPGYIGINSSFIDIISIFSSDKLFCDFIYLNAKEGLMYADGGFYHLKKLSDEPGDIDSYTSDRQEPKDVAAKIPAILRSGVLLGLRSQNNEGYAYRTLWIASTDTRIHPILETKDLFVPRKSGFWKVGIQTYKTGDVMQDILFARPINKADISKQASDEFEEPIEQHITFVSDDYVAVEYQNSSDDDRFYVLPLDDVSKLKGVRISDVLGQDAKNTFLRSAQAHLSSLEQQMPDDISSIISDDNFTLERRNGHWVIKGRLNMSGRQEDFTVGVMPSDKLVNYDDLCLSWNDIKEEVPSASDAYTSPNKDVLIALGNNFLSIYAIRDGVISSKPARKITIKEGETVVMAEWAMGSYVPKWEESFSKTNPLVVRK
ncbi:hypothetical protein [Mahella australiensis]|uniref:hypothetical protein n=1 Tax=Mahella australiensis TaxID=252966 RepID=UPI0002F97564|nr:hypothetical protein [Mahella australiensis]